MSSDRSATPPSAATSSFPSIKLRAFIHSSIHPFKSKCMCNACAATAMPWCSCQSTAFLNTITGIKFITKDDFEYQ